MYCMSLKMFNVHYVANKGRCVSVSVATPVCAHCMNVCLFITILTSCRAELRLSGFCSSSEGNHCFLNSDTKWWAKSSAEHCILELCRQLQIKQSWNSCIKKIKHSDFASTEFTAYLWKEAREYLFEDSLGALSSGRDKELKNEEKQIHFLYDQHDFYFHLHQTMNRFMCKMNYLVKNLHVEVTFFCIMTI